MTPLESNSLCLLIDCLHLKEKSSKLKEAKLSIITHSLNICAIETTEEESSTNHQ
jgi:hypothetical protein